MIYSQSSYDGTAERSITAQWQASCELAIKMSYHITSMLQVYPIKYAHSFVVATFWVSSGFSCSIYPNYSGLFHWHCQRIYFVGWVESIGISNHKINTTMLKPCLGMYCTLVKNNGLMKLWPTTTTIFINPSPPGWNGRHFVDEIFFMRFSLKFVPNGLTDY